MKPEPSIRDTSTPESRSSPRSSALNPYHVERRFTGKAALDTKACCAFSVCRIIDRNE